uniref:N_BRCA1_IG domain-containing protein n=2 Tax=Wuchereria bancrofti TaxID=6293 RepID=A0A1I8EPU2_WUCBA
MEGVPCLRIPRSEVSVFIEMDIDGDVNGSLSQALSCMATSDHEVLIKQFQQVLGDSHTLSAEACAFFLDMNSWNLQAALGAYYDYGSANGTGSPPPEYITQLPSMQFVQDITIGEGESVPPSTRFIKTWRVRNSGNEWWPNGCFLCYMEGDKLSDTTRSWIQPLAPGKEANVSIEMVSPLERGIYQSRWQLNTNSGIPFGESIWCIITVDDVGILGITQQLASAPLGSSASTRSQNMNPFGGVLPFNYALQNSAEQPERVENNVNESCDMPFNQDGNSSLYNAVVNRLPRVWSVNSCQFPNAISEPIDISHIEEAPDVPPCTPCTPPQ